MPSPAAAAGRSTGYRLGLESARQRRLQEEDRQAERELRSLQMESAESGLEQSRFGLSRARTEAKRADEAYARSMDELNKRNQQEGVLDFVNALNHGVGGQRAMELFNSSGTLQLADVQHDPESGRLVVTDSDGETQEFENPEAFAYAFGAEPPKPERQDLVATDKPIYDPNSGKWIMPPGGDGMSPKDRYDQVGDYIFDRETGDWLSPPGAEGDSGRDLSPYNPQAVQDDVVAGVVRRMGGSFDAYGNYAFGADADRQLGDYRIARAQEIAGRLEDLVSASKVAPGSIVEAVFDATRDMPSEAELAAQAERWRTEGRDKTQEQAARWLSDKRNEIRTGVDAELAKAERRLREQAVGSSQSMREKPSWAGNEVPATEIPSGANLQSGVEYQVEDENGRQFSIRLAPDGKIYEVGGASDQSNSNQSNNVDDTLSDARRRSRDGAPLY